MKLVFLPPTRADLAWMRTYYTRIFSDGARRAAEAYVGACDLVRDHPAIGRPVVGMAGIRELLIPRTPFSFIYRVTEDQIEVLRVWDQRGDRQRLRSSESRSVSS